jgi:hypothetical protein
MRRSVVLFVCIQALLPLWAWRVDSPYFAWNMFSYVKPPPTVVIVRSETIDTVNVQRYLGFTRGDLSYGPTLGPQICQLEPNALAVRIIPHDGVLRETQCR